MNVDLIKDKLGFGDDKIYGVIGEFSEPDDLVEAGRKIREMGYTKLDAMSPFPVHGIDDAIGVPPSKLGWIVIFFSALGEKRRRTSVSASPSSMGSLELSCIALVCLLLF